MKWNCYLMPGDSRNSCVPGDLPNRNAPVVDCQSTVAWGDRARQETESFINSNIRDVTKGWPVLSRITRRIIT